MMTKRFIWLILPGAVGALACAARSHQHLVDCPREAPTMRRIAVRFAGSQRYAATRTEYGLPTLDSTRVRTLTTEQGDGAACARVMRLVQQTDSVLAGPGMRLTFFEAREQYYVVGVRSDWVDPPPPGVIRLGWSVLWVVTATGKPKVIARIAV